MWRFAGQDIKAARAKIDAALEIGINLFDTADIYGPDNGEPFGAAEALLGRVFTADPGLRHRMVLATKGGISMGVPYDSSAGYLVRAVDDSLTRLKVDVIDLYQIHRPDILTHPAEVAQTMMRLHAQGKVRSWRPYGPREGVGAFAEVWVGSRRRGCSCSAGLSRRCCRAASRS